MKNTLRSVIPVVGLFITLLLFAPIGMGVAFGQVAVNGRYDIQNVAKVLTTATTNGTVVNIPPAGQFGPSGSAIPAPTLLRSWSITNTSASYTIYVHFYDSLTAPVVGTTVSKFTIAIPPSATATDNSTITGSEAVLFKYGMSYSISKGSIDTDTTATLAGDGVGVIMWSSTTI